MRHGPAEDRAPSGRDSDRRLTVEGRAVVLTAARMLGAARSEPLATILSSPLARAVETAEIVLGETGAPRTQVALREELAAEEPPAFELFSELARAGIDALVVGHQPTAEIAIRSLCKGAPGLRAVRTATIAAMRWDGHRWSLASVIDPYA